MVANALVLGLGSIGLRHGANLLGLGVGVIGYDPDLSRQAKARTLGFQIAQARSAAIERADAVIVASPTVQHVQDLHDAVLARKPVFVEKPLAHVEAGLEEILARASAPVFPALVLRHDLAVKEAKHFLSDLGGDPVLNGHMTCESFLPDWRPGSDYRSGYAADPISGGVLFDHLHEVDLGWFLLGPLTLRSARATSHGGLGLASEERAELELAHGSGRLRIDVDFSVSNRPARRDTVLEGLWGRLELDIAARRVKVWDNAGRAIRDSLAAGSYQQDYVDQMKLFLDVAAGRARPSCTVGEAMNVLRLVIAARRLAGLPCG